MHNLLCFVDGMLVGTIVSSIIPRIGETIHLDNFDNTLLEGETWEVLHVNYSFQSPGKNLENWSIDTLNQISLTLIESKTVDGTGTLSASAQQALKNKKVSGPAW